MNQFFEPFPPDVPHAEVKQKKRRLKLKVGYLENKVYLKRSVYHLNFHSVNWDGERWQFVNFS